MNHLEGIRAVTFDVGGTLIEAWPSVGHVYAEVAARHGVEADPAALNERFAESWRAKQNFDYSRAHWFTVVEEAFAGIAPVSAGMFDDIYDHFKLAVPWRVFDDVLPALEALKRKGIKLALISNWDDRLRPLLRASGLDRHFDVTIISTEVGVHKPDRRIFEAALSQLNVPAGQALHIGDALREDVEGARAAGMRTLLLDRDGYSGCEGAIASLAALGS